MSTTDEFEALGALVAEADIGRESDAAALSLERGMRASLLCTWFGLERESWVWPFVRTAGASAAGRLLAGLFAPLGGIGHLATMAGASDLDPMDPGPSHTVLPATLAACVAAACVDDAIAVSDAELASAVLAGVEAAWRIRSAVTGTRPGVGFHSPGVYGALAAAASASRLLRLDAARCIDALAIALTRASGLATNSAASMIGLTHFGWGAVHGFEAALLASEGWGASHDFHRGLATLFGEDRVDARRLDESGTRATDALVFKRYPCNIYLNLVVTLLEAAEGPVDRIDVELPWVPHLDCPAPRDLRQARNSAQAVAAIAGAGDISYAAFSGPPGPWVPSDEVRRLLPNVRVTMDEAAATGLTSAVVAVKAWRGGDVVLDSGKAMRELGGWGVEHARRLIGADDTRTADALYGGSHRQAFEYVDGVRRGRVDAPRPAVRPVA